MKLFELLENIPVLKWQANPNTEILGISSDSRRMQEGFAFLALPGLKADGRMWIPSAFEKGAVLAICQEAPTVDVPYVLVENARSALPHLLSNFHHHPEKSFARIIGITGTNGKTTTSFMLREIFQTAGHKTGLIGTTKYLVGEEEYPVDPSAAFLTTPDPELLFDLFCAMRDKGVDTVIMETSSHALGLNKLEGIEFHVGIFTNLTQDHMDFHNTMEEYLKAKKKLFRACKLGIFNLDDPNFGEMTKDASCTVKTYSAKSDSADYFVRQLLSQTDKEISYLLQTPEEEEEIFIPIPGAFTVYNSLAAATCALECGIPLSLVTKALSKMPGIAGRIERIETDTPYSVFIDFAHTPDALENILKTLRGITRGKLITLFGCGGDRDKTKRPIMGKIAGEMSDFVIVTSDNSRSEEKGDIIRDILPGVEETGKAFVTVEDRTEAIHFALDRAEEGDVILLAGKGHEEYEIDKNGKHPYSEKNIVLEYIGEKK